MFPRCSGADLQARRARSCAELERRLRAGEDARAEDYLDSDPALAADADSALELIYAEFVTRNDLGQAPPRDQWSGRFPQWSNDLQDLLQIHDLMQESLEQGFAGGAEPGVDPDPEWAPEGFPCRVGHCELLEEVGRGAMGVVYKARDLNLGRLVALKMLRTGAHCGAGPGLDQFRGEAEAVARLQHPNIVQIHEIFPAAGRAFISLEFVDGGSLKQAMAEGPKDPPQAASLIEVVARAIAYAHRRGIVHHDLKPANVLLAVDGVPKVVDFGLAEQRARDRDRRGDDPCLPARRMAITGTPAYMAPEQLAAVNVGDGLPADIYALGAILYELLTGRTPLGADPCIAILERGAAPEPAPPSRIRPRIPRDLDAICLKCLKTDPARRYADAGALADDLRRFLAGEPVHARPIGAWEWGWKWARRRPAAAALAAVSAVAILALLAGSIVYNARLSALAHREERHRAEAERQARLFRDQLEFSRRSVYALQLTHIETSLERNPGLGLALLKDKRYCPDDLRDFAWGYFYRLCKRKRIDLRLHHLGLVDAVAFSPDGGLLAVAGGHPDRAGPPGQVKLFDPASETRELGTLVDPLGPIKALAFAADGRTLATAGGAGSGRLRLWDLASRTERLAIQAHPGMTLAVAFRPDGRELATGGGEGAVRLWDARDGHLRAELPGHDGAVRCLAYAPGGATLASAGDDGMVRIWEQATGRTLPLPPEDRVPVNGLAYAPDGRTLACARADQRVDLWDLAESRPRAVLRGHMAAVRSVVFSPDGATLITGGDECIVRIWRAGDGRELTALNIHDAAVTSVAFAPTGDVFASGSYDQTAKVWDLVPGRQRPPLRGHSDKVTAAAFAPDGSRILTAGRDGYIRLWDHASGRVKASLPAPALGSGSESALGLEPELESEPESDSESESLGALKCLALTRRGDLVAAGGSDGVVRVWDLDGGVRTRVLSGHEDEVTSLAFAPDGLLLASASLDATVRLWDPATGRCLSAWRAHKGGAQAVAFAPDGKIVATAGEDRMVRLWETAGGRELAALKGHQRGVLSLAFHPGGKTLASGSKDRNIKLWDLATARERTTLLGHNHWVCAIVFSPDGKTMASSTGDPGPNAVGEVKLWDAVTGHVRATFQGQTVPIAFAADGRTLLTGNHDETVNLLEVASEYPRP
jgi:WD40 repeat protein